MESLQLLFAVVSGVASMDRFHKLYTHRGIRSSEPNSFIDGAFNEHPVTTMIDLKVAKLYTYETHINVGEDVSFIKKCMTFNNKYLVVNKVLYYYEEIGVISAKKLLYYQLSSARSRFTLNSGSIRYILFLERILKLFIYALFTPIVGVDYFVKRRGKPVIEQMNIEFEKLLLSFENTNVF